jgi:hypothetical protein
MELLEQYDTLFDKVRLVQRMNKFVEVGIEIDGQQNIHIFALKELMTKYDVYFSFARQKGSKPGSEGIRSRLEGGNKHWRFRNMLPWFQNHKIWFPKNIKDSPDMKELMSEIKYTSYSGFGGHDDGIDCVSMLGAIQYSQPSQSDSTLTSGSGVVRKDFLGKIMSKKSEDDGSTAYDGDA